MFSRAIQRLASIQPGLARWLGDRPDLQVPALGFSVLTHAVLLLAFGMIGYAAHTERDATLRTEVIDTALPDFSSLDDDETALSRIDEPTAFEPTVGSFAPTLAPIVAMPAPGMPGTASPDGGGRPAMPELENLALNRIAEVALPMASRLDDAVSIRGSGSEHVGAVEGAVDRIAVEILRRLERGRTLVVWAFDASGSLLSERERLARHVGRVYDDLARYDGRDLAAEGGLLTTVVAFGKDRKVMLPEPTADPAAIAGAIVQVPIDASGVETTFGTVLDVVRRFGKFRKGGDAYKTMVIVVTDEVGDDERSLEEAIGAAQAAEVPVFVLGSAAVFGRLEGHMDYTDPKTKQTFRRVPVRQGPESALLEQIRLPYWYDGPQFDELDAGFGPYALSRLAGATGGIYFVTRMGPHPITFDPAGMREYRPDWFDRAKYEAAVQQDPLRRAVLQAAQATQQDLPRQPGLTFPPADDASFKDAMGKNQELVARIEYTVDAALEPITAVVKVRDHETSRRWQAHYDLIRGRLLAMKVRCYEYNAACARMKLDAPRFSQPKSNAWRLVPDAEIHSSDKAAAAGKEAVALLKRVVDDHPGTPWAVLAQRELKDPLGLKWVEAYVPPRPKESGNNNNKKATPKKTGNARPAEPPKL